MTVIVSSLLKHEQVSQKSEIKTKHVEMLNTFTMLCKQFTEHHTENFFFTTNQQKNKTEKALNWEIVKTTEMHKMKKKIMWKEEEEEKWTQNERVKKKIRRR